MNDYKEYIDKVFKNEIKRLENQIAWSEEVWKEMKNDTFLTTIKAVIDNRTISLSQTKRLFKILKLPVSG